ncbi:karyogamy protein [Geranomyces michiganensis]|nr:karyogamy protein [Geranomyces michiganensis]
MGTVDHDIERTSEYLQGYLDILDIRCSFRSATELLDSSFHGHLTREQRLALENANDAVYFTRCEIATANIPIPNECKMQAVDRDVYPCIEILSHAPQLWTSYSGYVREVVNMCFAIQYENHRDNVEQLFSNVTAHQISSYRLLRRQHKDMESWHDQQMTRLTAVEKLHLSLILQADNIKSFDINRVE